MASTSTPFTPLTLAASTGLLSSPDPAAAEEQQLARLWYGFDDDAVGLEFRQLRQSMPSHLVAGSSGEAWVQPSPATGATTMRSTTAGDASIAFNHGPSPGWGGGGVAASSIGPQAESAATLWMRHQLERYALLNKYDHQLGVIGQLDETSALRNLSARQAEWTSLFLRQVQEVQAAVNGPTLGMIASVQTIVPPDAPSAVQLPGTCDDEMMFVFEDDVTPRATTVGDSTARVPDSVTLDSSRGFGSPNLSSGSSDSFRDASIFWGSPEISSGASSWTTQLNFVLDDGPKFGATGGLASAPTALNPLADYQLPSALSSPLVSNGGTGPMDDSNYLMSTLPSAGPTPDSKPIRRTPTGAPFERSKFSCDRCARARKKCNPHPRADGTHPQHGDCVECVRDASRRHLLHVDCTYETRAANVDRARKNGSLWDAYHSVQL